MKSAKTPKVNPGWLTRSLFLLGLVLFGNVVCANAQSAQSFASPDDAAKELIAAVRANDRVTLTRILAPDANRLFSGDAVQEQQERDRFVKMADDRIDVSKVTDSQYSVELGNDGWPFPVPIVKRGDQWAFDSSQGVNELLLRRVGRNELTTILVCAAYAVAQWDYFLEDDWNNDGVQEFAQKFVSSPGQKDGLFWADADQGKQSPLGPLVAYARTAGYRGERDAAGNIKPTPIHGYYLKILKAQGPSASGGKYSYLINGRMIGGFALVAYPAVYGSSGVMTFIVNQQGKIHQQNLGPNTEKIAQAMTVYNPDRGWEYVNSDTVLALQP